jgi:hypothetical protein
MAFSIFTQIHSRFKQAAKGFLASVLPSRSTFNAIYKRHRTDKLNGCPASSPQSGFQAQALVPAAMEYSSNCLPFAYESCKWLVIDDSVKLTCERREDSTVDIYTYEAMEPVYQAAFQASKSATERIVEQALTARAAENIGNSTASLASGVTWSYDILSY